MCVRADSKEHTHRMVPPNLGKNRRFWGFKVPQRSPAAYTDWNTGIPSTRDARDVARPDDVLYKCCGPVGFRIHSLRNTYITNTFRPPHTTKSTSYDGVDSTGLDSSRQTDFAQLHRFCMGKVPLPMEELEGAGASGDAMAFVRQLLVPDPPLRLSALAALGTPWLQSFPSARDWY